MGARAEATPGSGGAREDADEVAGEAALGKGQTESHGKKTSFWRTTWHLSRETVMSWLDDKAPRLGASLSYYTVFALAPVLLVAISVAALIVGRDAAQGRILNELTSILGADGGKMVQTMLAKSAARSSGIIGTLVGIGGLIAGATAVMIELEAALDAVWRVKERPGRGIFGVIKDRVLSLGLVLTVGFLLVVSLLASAILSAVGGQLEHYWSGASIVAPLLANLISFVVIGTFFALLFKLLPKAKVAWRDVAIGAGFTSLLFHLGKVGIGFYLGRASVGSTFGAAGSLAILLVWIYYTAQIVLLGAEFTRVYAGHNGRPVVPDDDAVSADPAETVPSPKTRAARPA